MPLHKHDPHEQSLDTSSYFTRGEQVEIPKNRMADGQMDPRSAYQIVHDEVMLDGNARLNTATFVTTWMDQQAKDLIAETLDKNMIDKDEYPMTAEIERRCVNIIADLWHADETKGDATGTSTIGSSEAAMLAGMAMKWDWRKRMEAAGRPADRPNIVMGANVQVCWEKFARYWDVEPRLVPVDEGALHLTAERALPHVDESTIGVVAILGSTFDGSYEPVEEICKALDDLQAKTGVDVPVHVDAASGGFVAPFSQPDLVWDFRLDRVRSINSSGHKYGLVYPGVGWVVWRDAEALPDELVFKVNYLGGEMPTFAINFSRPGNQVIAQYYSFLRYGREGYAKIQNASRDVARQIAEGFERIGPFEALTKGEDLPVIAVRVRKDASPSWTVFDVSHELRAAGWQVPAYTFPENLEDMAVLRVVVRHGMSADLATLLLADLERVVGDLDRHGGRPEEAQHPATFHH